MEKYVSGSESLEQNAITVEDPTSSDEDPTRNHDVENEALVCDLCGDQKRRVDCACQKIVATCSCPPNAAPSPSCVFYSPRIQGLCDGQKAEFGTAREHWTVVDPESQAEAESVAEENRKYFNELLVHHPQWGAFFTRFEDLEVGAKIGDGRQAEIFRATSQSFEEIYFILEEIWQRRYPRKVFH